MAVVLDIPQPLPPPKKRCSISALVSAAVSAHRPTPEKGVGGFEGVSIARTGVGPPSEVRFTPDLHLIYT